MEQFIKNFSELLEETDLNLLTSSTKFKELEEWDSMTTLMLIAMFDEKYDVKLTGSQLSSSTTIEDLYKFTL